jgi:hypothetical protein
MSDTPTCNWPGASGRTYKYYVFPIGTRFTNETPANYVYCAESPAHGWKPQYIGQTGNLRERLGNHEKEACAIAQGATHLHVHLSGAEADRLVEEKDLIQHFNPCCNEQLVA